MTLHASPINISYQETFSLFNPADGPRGLDFPFAVVGHEVAHQWWGNQVTYASVEGAPVLSESLAWYSAMMVVEKSYGHEHLRRLLKLMREAYLTPHARANVPLLRATDWLQGYRKGPFAMYALREYIGEERVNVALRRLLQKHGSGEPPLPTSLDLYRELQAVTPDSFRGLLADLFEANTFWELAAERVTARQAATGSWQVTLDVQARKVVVDSVGVETEVPMNDLVEVGVFAAAEDGGLGEPLYLRVHRVRSGEQRITVTVPRKPVRAGIDPRSLLIDVEATDNLREITLPAR
jgi:aminopeptidase N